MWYTSTPREHVAGTIDIGHFVTSRMIIPPSVDNFTTTGVMPPQCTSVSCISHYHGNHKLCPYSYFLRVASMHLPIFFTHMSLVCYYYICIVHLYTIPQVMDWYSSTSVITPIVRCMRNWSQLIETYSTTLTFNK